MPAKNGVSGRIRKELKILQVASSNGAGGDAKQVAPRTSSSTTSAKGEASALRRELALKTNERAEMELELLNAVAGLEAEKTALSDRLAQLTLERDDGRRRLDEMNEEIEAMKRLTAHDRNAKDDLVEQLAAKGRDLTEAVGALELADREVKQLKAELQSKSGETSVVSAAASNERKEIERLEAALSHLNALLQTRNEEIDDLKSTSLQEKKELERVQSALADNNALLQTRNGEIDELKSTLKISAEEVGRLAMQDIAKQEENEELRDVLKTSTEQTAALGEEVAKLREQKKADMRCIKELKDQLEPANTERNTRDADIKRIKDLEGQLEKANNERNTLRDQIKETCTLREQKEANERRIKKLLEDQLDKADGERNNKEADESRIKELEDQLDKANTELNALRDQNKEMSTLREQKEADKKHTKDLEDQLEKADGERNALREQNEVYMQHIEALVDNENGTDKEMLALRGKIARLEKEFEESDAINGTLQHEIQVIQSVLRLTEKQNDDLQQQLQALEDQQKEAERSTHEQIQHRVACAINERNDEIEELRRELECANMREGELDMELLNQRNAVATLEKEKVQISTELERHLEEIITGNSQLQARLQAKEDEVLALRGDMTALRQQMKSYVASRSQELDDIESELVKKTRLIAEKERTIQSLRALSNDEVKSSNGNVITVIPEEYSDSPRTVNDPAVISPEPFKAVRFARSVQGYVDMREVKNEREINELRVENKELSEEVSALSKELQKLKETNRHLRDGQGSSSPNATRILRKRNETLKTDVEKATRRLKALEKSISKVKV